MIKKNQSAQLVVDYGDAGHRALKQDSICSNRMKAEEEGSPHQNSYYPINQKQLELNLHGVNKRMSARKGTNNSLNVVSGKQIQNDKIPLGQSLNSINMLEC